MKTAYQVALEIIAANAHRNSKAEADAKAAKLAQMRQHIIGMLTELGRLDRVKVDPDNQLIAVTNGNDPFGYVVVFRDDVFQWFAADDCGTISSYVHIGLAITVEDLHQRFGEFIGNQL